MAALVIKRCMDEQATRLLEKAERLPAGWALKKEKRSSNASVRKGKEPLQLGTIESKEYLSSRDDQNKKDGRYNSVPLTTKTVNMQNRKIPQADLVEMMTQQDNTMLLLDSIEISEEAIHKDKENEHVTDQSGF